MLPDAYAENSNWTKDDEGKSKLIIKPILLRPSFFNDLSLQIKRSMIVDDLKILFKGERCFKKNHPQEREIKEAYLRDFKRTGKLKTLMANAPDYQLPKVECCFYTTYLQSNYDFEEGNFAEYVFEILMKTDYGKKEILEVLNTFKQFHDWSPNQQPPEWKKDVVNSGWSTAICQLIWIRGKSGMKCYGSRCSTNSNNVKSKGWTNFYGDETRPKFFYKRVVTPKVKKGSNYKEIAEWFFQQFYLIQANRNPYQSVSGAPSYWEMDASVRNAIQMGWDSVKNQSKIDIEDEFRIFAMPEYKIKPRSYESVVNSIAW